MKTIYIGRLINNISIEGFINKQPTYKDYEILFHDEQDVLKSYKGGIIKEISYDIELLNNIVFKSDVKVVDYYTTNNDFIHIENDIANVVIDKTVKYLYIPILKYLKSITVIDSDTSTFKVVTNELYKNENIITLNINSVNIPYREIELKNNVLDSITINLHLIDIAHHYNDYSNPHNVSKYQIGLGEVDNTSDLNKPISIANKNFIEQSIRDFNTKCESYFKNHSNTIDDVVISLSSTFKSIIDEFTETIITDAKDQLEAVKRLGSIEKLIDSKFANFNTISNNLHDRFKENANELLETVNDVIRTLNRKELDFINTINELNEKTGDSLLKYENRVASLERQLEEHARVIRAKLN